MDTPWHRQAGKILAVSILLFIPLVNAGHNLQNVGTWSKQTTADDTSVWWDIAWSSDLELFAAVGGASTSRVQTSPDGEAWTLRTTPNLDFFTIAWGGGIFCALEWTGSVASRSIHSSDGITWSSTFNGPNQMLARDMVYVDDLTAFVAVGVTDTNRVWKSSDCENWTAFSSADDAREWYGLTYDTANNKLCAVASTGTNTGRAMYSSDGESWTPATGVINVNHFWKGVAWSDTLGLFAAGANTVGDNMNLMTSSDCITWTARTVPNTFGVPLWAMLWVGGTADTPFFAGFHGGTGSTLSGEHSTPNVIVSTDGITWNAATGTQASADLMEIALYEGAAWAPEIGVVVGIVHTGTGSGEGPKKAITGDIAFTPPAPPPPPGLEEYKDFFAAGWGLSDTIAGLLLGLGVITMLAFVFLRATQGSFLIASIGAFMGLVFAVKVGFIDVWLLLVVIFAIVVMASIFMFGNNPEGASE